VITMAAGLADDYRLERRPPTVRELRALNKAVGWTDLPEDDDAVARGLAASLFGVVLLTAAGEVAGCARVVGDGGVYFYVQDLIVAPSCLGLGLGDVLLDEVREYLESAAPAGAFIGLMAAEGKAGFYARRGFAARSGDAPGMWLTWTPRPDGRRREP
jgi:ribosomal protein S18 acetylase RimI-like enzyme